MNPVLRTGESPVASHGVLKTLIKKSCRVTPAEAGVHFKIDLGSGLRRNDKTIVMNWLPFELKPPSPTGLPPIPEGGWVDFFKLLTMVLVGLGMYWLLFKRKKKTPNE